jgi:hypothetical protein
MARQLGPQTWLFPRPFQDEVDQRGFVHRAEDAGDLLGRDLGGGLSKFRGSGF